MERTHFAAAEEGCTNCSMSC